MPTREQTITDAVQILDNAVYPSGLNTTTAWLGIYQALLWYEPVHQSGFDVLPHIIDADKLRPSPAAKSRSHTSPSVWQQRAKAINEYLAQQLDCAVEDVPDKTDLLMKPIWLSRNATSKHLRHRLCWPNQACLRKVRLSSSLISKRSRGINDICRRYRSWTQQHPPD